MVISYLILNLLTEFDKLGHYVIIAKQKGHSGPLEMKDWCWIAIVILFLLFTILVAGIALAQAPIIGNVTAGNITDTSAIITWDTLNVLSNSTVNYYNGTLPWQSVSDGAFVYNHSITLNSLTPNTLYYFEVISSDGLGNTTIGNNSGAYYTFTTSAQFDLEGWGWCTNYNQVAIFTFDGYTTMVSRTGASNSYSMHAVGNLTLQAPYNETIPLDMYGSRVRSLFYLRQEITGKRVGFQGTWLDSGGNQTYISMTGTVALSNPGGNVLKTARVCSVYLRTPSVEVPLVEPGSFVADLESMWSRYVKFVDKVVDSLVGTGIGGILSNILSKIAVLLAHLRALGTPYIP